MTFFGDLGNTVGWLALIAAAFWIVVIIGCVREDMKERKP